MAKLNQIKIQIKALYTQISEYLEVLHTLDNAKKENVNESPQPTDRERYYNDSGESYLISGRYRRLCDDLENLYPDIFSDLMDFHGGDGVRALEALSREVSSILLILESLESENPSYYNHRDFTFNQPLNENETSVVIFLDCSSNVLVIASKLNSLYKIYNELCELLNVSTAQYPLRIGSLEVGSLWATIFGESKVIALMTKFFEETAAYIYRTRTPEGKRKGVVEKASELKQLIELETELKKQNYNVEGMHEHIQKSAHLLSQDYYNLIFDSNAVRVNEKTYDFTEANPRGLFQNPKPPLLLENKDGETD